MATGGRYDFEMDHIGDARNYPLPENYDKDIGETSFNNPIYDDATTYNTSDNSNLSDASLEPEERAALNKYKVSETISDLYSPINKSIYSEYKLNYLRRSNFTDGTKWRFTDTNKMELAELVYTHKEVMGLTQHLKPAKYTAGVIAPNLEDYYDIRQENSLYIIGNDRKGKMNWVRNY